ncbi:MAG TPA: PilZ domain-containing protein [Gemmatimonadales bacterium]|nr:PilZ domain-containing protein [Gemmatimonadales bacterium]
MMETPRRHAPRLTFSGRPAPRLETPDHVYEVVDLSSEGLRLRSPDHVSPGLTIGDVLRATLRFPADRAVEIEGRVLRVSGEEAALRLIQGQDRLATDALPAGPVSPRRSGLLW